MADIQFVDQKTGKAVFERTFNPSQLTFWNSSKQFVVLNGGYGSGKTEPLILKTISDAMQYPDNYILMGRKTYQEIYDVLIKDFMDICPPQFIKSYRKSPHPSVELYCPNTDKTSTIIFRNQDKLAETEIKGLNLGGISIDQAEDIPEAVFQALTFRLRRQNTPHKVYMTLNPALNWIYQRAKKDNDPRWDVIEAPSTENYHNLPSSTVEMYESYKETDPAYYKQYVLGVWDESLLAENLVFAREHIQKLNKTEEAPKRTYEGLRIYRNFDPEHRYQMGIDCAEGVAGGDRASITIADLSSLEVVAQWDGRLPPDVVAEKAVVFADLYSKNRYNNTCIINPEMNSIGFALIQKLKELGWERYYQREEFDKKSNLKSKKIGWRTTPQTKPLMVSNFRHLIRNFPVRIHDKEILDEFKSFIYSDEARLKGMGAQTGYHDDRVISTLLAFWEKTRRSKDAKIIRVQQNTIPVLECVPSVRVINGKVKVSSIKGATLIGEETRSKSWTIG